MKLLITLLIFYTASAQAEFLYLGRSPKGLLMGDAFTAVADDEYTLFYNPAALGRNHQLEVVVFHPKLEGPDVANVSLKLDKVKFTYDKEFFKDFPDEPEDMADKLMGVPIYLKVGMTPTIKIKSFALSFFGNAKLRMLLENAIHPELHMKYHLDRGIALGQAFSFGRGSATLTGFRTSVGIAAKYISRQSIDSSFALMGPELLHITDRTNSPGANSTRRALGYAKGKGKGYDLGVETSYFMRNSYWTVGLSALDISDTKFKREEGDRELKPQERSINLGMAWNQRFTLLDYTLSLDYSNFEDPITPSASKLKIGMRARFPTIELYFGANGGYLSWGIGLDLPFIKLMLGFYGVETGNAYKTKEDKRILLSMELFSFGSS